MRVRDEARVRHYLKAVPYIVSFIIIKLFSLLNRVNTRAKMNHKGDTISTPLSMNELTTVYLKSYMN